MNTYGHMQPRASPTTDGIHIEAQIKMEVQVDVLPRIVGCYSIDDVVPNNNLKFESQPTMVDPHSEGDNDIEVVDVKPDLTYLYPNHTNSEFYQEQSHNMATVVNLGADGDSSVVNNVVGAIDYFTGSDYTDTFEERYLPTLQKQMINLEREENDEYENPHTSLPNQQKNKICNKTKRFRSSTFQKTFGQRYFRAQQDQMQPRRRTHQCDDCHKSFTSPSNLSMHKQRIHEKLRPFQCDTCRKSFNQRYQLKQHEMCHTGERPHHCEHCSQSFTQRNHLQRHILCVHDRLKPYKCLACDKAFGRKGNLRCHERTHTGERPHRCQHCGKAFVQGSHLKKHIRSIHNEIKLTQHEACSRKDSCNKRLNVQKESHAGEREYTCKHCGTSFKKCKTFKRHIHSVHGMVKSCHSDFSKKQNCIKVPKLDSSSNINYFQCSQCPESFQKESHLISHEQMHDEGNPHYCKVCNKTFSRSSNFEKHKQSFHAKQSKSPIEGDLVRHEQSHHGDDAQVRNDTIKLLIRRVNRIRHEAILSAEEPIHSDDPPKPGDKLGTLEDNVQHVNDSAQSFKCSTCNESFTRRRILKEHEQTHTTEQQPFRCDQCEKSFTQSSHLQRHIRSVHDRCVSFSCPMCHKTFTQKSHLIRHQQTHTGEKPFQCGRCKKAFTRSDNLERHTHVVHGIKRSHDKSTAQSDGLGEDGQRVDGELRPFHCSTCNKTFQTKSGLLSHQRTHSKTQQYHCTLCGKNFSHSTELKNHKKVEHALQSGKLHRKVTSGNGVTSDVTITSTYCCDQCSKTFTRSSALKGHKDIWH